MLPVEELDEVAQRSIHLAVAQWLGSAHATSVARASLRAAGVDEPEIDARRRARSRDARLAAILRLAVTLLIARGRLTARDLAALRPERPLLRAIVAATADAYANVLRAEALETSPFEAIEMRLEDY